MAGLSSIERDALSACTAEPMLDQVRGWAEVNSGSRNLAGLDHVAAMLADAFSALPGQIDLEAAAPVDAIAADGSAVAVAHGRNLHLVVRPEAPVQLLLTGRARRAAYPLARGHGYVFTVDALDRRGTTIATSEPLRVSAPR